MVGFMRGKAANGPKRVPGLYTLEDHCSLEVCERK
jgi:hypothetical protein